MSTMLKTPSVSQDSELISYVFPTILFEGSQLVIKARNEAESKEILLKDYELKDVDNTTQEATKKDNKTINKV
jgi:hypothetical protein